MSARANKPVSVTLGPLAAKAEARVRSGDYSSISEVLRDGIRALDREDATFEAILKAKVAEALADGRPDIGAEEVSLGLRNRHHERLKRDG
jgi:antitoxin ParD1/3/4